MSKRMRRLMPPRSGSNAGSNVQRGIVVSADKHLAVGCRVAVYWRLDKVYYKVGGDVAAAGVAAARVSTAKTAGVSPAAEAAAAASQYMCMPCSSSVDCIVATSCTLPPQCKLVYTILHHTVAQPCHCEPLQQPS
jgi:hypothetical protein